MPNLSPGGLEPERILRPVNPAFIVLSLVLSFGLNLLPWGRWFWIPDFVALTMVFWNIHQPRRVGIGAAFLMGILMDVHDATILGEHALAYTLMAYGALLMHRRIQWFLPTTQAVHLLPLFVGAHLITVLVRMMIGGGFPGWLSFVESPVTVLLWPLATWVLLAPQRRPISRDSTRPI